VGRTVDVKVRRNNRDETVKVTADRAPALRAGRITGVPGLDLRLPDVHIDLDRLSRNVPRVQVSTAFVQSGIRVDQMTDQLRSFFGVSGDNGVLVTSVDAGSAAEKAGLKAGDVITAIDGRNVRTPADFSREMRADSKPALKVTRDKQERDIRIE